MKIFQNEFARSTRLACAVAGFALAVGLAPHGAVAQEGPSILMADENGATVAADGAALMAKAQQQGSIRVIVGLDTGFSPEGSLSAADAATQRAGISAAQARMMDALDSPTEVREYQTIPYMAMSLSPGDLSSMMKMPGVTSIQEDIAVPPALADSIPLVRANRLWRMGIKGESAAVAVLDTGTRNNHVAFRDAGGRKMIASACFSSTTNGSFPSNTLCPNGQDQQVRNNNGKAGEDCDTSIDGCGHGTHVAGIAAGSQSGNHGMAQLSDVIPIQVFSEFTTSSACGSSVPCALSWTSDQMLGLEQVLLWVQNGVNIAAANMSLGGSRFFAHCDTDARKAIIDNLRAAGVATTISSGNNGFNDSTGAPGCISSAVTVGSTTKTDDVSSFSNHFLTVDLLAPGSSIRSASADGSRQAQVVFNGTSMAAPHVAGAFALLKDAVPTATVDQMERALKCTGVQVTRANMPKPRISMKDALDFLNDPDVQKTYTFRRASQVNKWIPVLGNWTHRSGNRTMRVIADTNSQVYLAQAPFCADDIKVTAEMARDDPDTNQEWPSGVILSSTASSAGNITGIAFLYSVSPANRTTVLIVTVEGSDASSLVGTGDVLCVQSFNGRDLGAIRKLVVEKNGNDLSFRIDGRNVCQVQTDTRFSEGHAGIVMGAPENDTSHRLHVHRVKLEALN